MTNCIFCDRKTCPNWGIDMWSDCEDPTEPEEDGYPEDEWDEEETENYDA